MDKKGEAVVSGKEAQNADFEGEAAKRGALELEEKAKGCERRKDRPFG